VGTRGRRIACHMCGLGSIVNLGPTVNSRHLDQIVSGPVHVCWQPANTFTRFASNRSSTFSNS